MPKHIGPGRIVFSYVDLIKVMDSVNYVTLGMSVVSILILLSFDLIFKAKIALKCKFPVPIQFMVVIIGTLISYCFDFKNNFNVKVIGEVPKGLPELSFPNFEDTLDLFPDVITITIIGFVVSLSISRIVATKHGYSGIHTTRPENEKKKHLQKTREMKLINFTDFSFILHFLVVVKLKLIYLNS